MTTEADLARIIYARTGISTPQFHEEYEGIAAACKEYADIYAAARVREALEEAAMIIDANAESCESGTRIMLRSQAAAIRAMIPEQ